MRLKEREHVPGNLGKKEMQECFECLQFVWQNRQLSVDWLPRFGQLTIPFIDHSLNHQGKHSSVKVKVQLGGKDVHV